MGQNEVKIAQGSQCENSHFQVRVFNVKEGNK